MNTVCPNCSTYLSTASDFCVACGTLVNAPKIQCFKCKQQSDANAPFCTHCGASFNFEKQQETGSLPSAFPVQSQAVFSQKEYKLLIAAASICAVLVLFVVLGGGYLLLSKSEQIKQSNANADSFRSNASSNSISDSAGKQRNTSSTSVADSTSSTTSSAENIAVRDEVSAALNRWKTDSEALNFSAYMDNYAGIVDYYRAGPVGRGRVANDKQRAFRLYDSIRIELNNMRVSTGADANKAVVIVDKSWNFKGGGKTNEGEVQQQLMLEKISGRWYITAEKDLKVYYSKSY